MDYSNVRPINVEKYLATVEPYQSPAISTVGLRTLLPEVSRSGLDDADADLRRRALERQIEILSGIANSALLLYRILNALTWILGIIFVAAVGVVILLLVWEQSTTALVAGLGGVADLGVVLFIGIWQGKAKEQLDATVTALNDIVNQRNALG